MNYGPWQAGAGLALNWLFIPPVYLLFGAFHMTRALIDDLNEQQRDIVFAPLQDIFVVAGAGTGKTRVLISRLVYLIEEEGIRPWNILAVTFTNKAAREMEERMMAAMGWDSNPGIRMSTFHSFCYGLLRRYFLEAGLPKDFSIISTSDQEQMVKNFYAEFGIDSRDEEYGKFSELGLTPPNVVSEISRLKEKGEQTIFSPEDIADFSTTLPVRWKSMSPDEIKGAFYAWYEITCSRMGLVDFSDLINKSINLLRDKPEIRNRLRKRYRYICIDEFQDTNTTQYEMLMLLKGPDNNIMVVGDDDQSIYGWRGANSRNLTRILTDLPDMEMYELNINYRSTQNILNVANAVIDYSEQRITSKFLVNPECYEMEKKNDLELINSLNRQQVIDCLIKSREFDYLDFNSFDEMLDAVTARQRDQMIDILSRDRMIPYDRLQERNAYKWQRHDMNALTNPQVSFVRIEPDGRNDGACVARLINSMIKKGFRYEDIAVLYRMNHLSGSVEQAMMIEGIPYRVFGGFKFYDRQEVADAMSYLKLIYNTNDDVSFERIVNTPRRGIGNSALAKVTEYARACGMSRYHAIEHTLKSGDSRSIKIISKFIPFFEFIEKMRASLQTLSLENFISAVIHESGLYEFYSKEDQKSRSARVGLSRTGNLDQLIANAKGFTGNVMALSRNNDYDDVEDDREMFAPVDPAHNMSTAELFESFMTNTALAASTELGADGTDDDRGVNLMTIHASKGLEFPVVLIVGCEEGVMPSYMAEDLDEERRLAYVAFTRARKHLYVCYSNERLRYGTSMEKAGMSRFLRDVRNCYDGVENDERPFNLRRFQGSYY